VQYCPEVINSKHLPFVAMLDSNCYTAFCIVSIRVASVRYLANPPSDNHSSSDANFRRTSSWRTNLRTLLS
jgi:hypothetical protein